MRIIGIYKIENLKNGKVYIGESFDVKRRWDEHKNYLMKGVHHNQKLQNDYDKYGYANLEFSILQEFKYVLSPFKTQMNLIYLEHKQIKKYDSIKLGYNLQDTMIDLLMGDG